ncbi:MAG: abortive infection family protein [Oscillospiraceae bacterium]|nr:abortive infection family protein [Oscillospiraceae bacterium]
MKTYYYFSERYKELISDGGFAPEFSPEQKDSVTQVMLDFAAPMRRQPNRYDSWTEETDALYEALLVFGAHQGWGTPSNFASDEILAKRSTCELFDIAEIQYEQLGGDAAVYQSEINDALTEMDCPFRLLNGRIIKIDAKQFEQDLKKKTLDTLERLRCDEPLFQSAYEEMLTAFERYELGDYKDAILKAECSFESMMKILLNNPNLTTAAANALIEGIAASDYFSEIPEDAIGIMKDKVLLSLPTVRNKCGSGHGQGTQAAIIPKSVANLALNLASTLNTFLADLYLEKVHSAVQETEGQSEFDDLPF